MQGFDQSLTTKPYVKVGHKINGSPTHNYILLNFITITIRKSKVMALINNLWKNEWIQHNSWMIAK